MKNYFEQAVNDIKKRYEGYLKDRDDCMNKAYIINENTAENTVPTFAGGTMLASFILNMLIIASTGTATISFTEGVNYLLPLFTNISTSFFPFIVTGLSLLGGKLFSLLPEIFTHNKAKFKKISKAKKEKEKVQEILDYEIQAIKDTYRFKLMTEIIDTLYKDKEDFEGLEKKYNITNNNTPQTYEETIANIENIQKELEEKYKELDVIATKKALHNRFYEFRIASNRHDKRFRNVILCSISLFMFLGFPYITVNEALPFNQMVRELTVFISLLGSIIGPIIYFVKKDHDLFKIFNKKNNSLGNDKLSKKPNKKELAELYEILKNYESVTLKICNLEVELQKQKAIKEVFENGDTEGYLLNKDYSHVNIPLMELSENSTDKTYDSPSPKMLIKE